MDAIKYIKNRVDSAVQKGGVAIGVSLDISNAFNSLPWNKIRLALVKKEVPDHLRRIIDDYLSERIIKYSSRYSEVISKRVTVGVPQESVFGPLLWNITYDEMLRVPTRRMLGNRVRR